MRFQQADAVHNGAVGDIAGTLVGQPPPQRLTLTLPATVRSASGEYCGVLHWIYDERDGTSPPAGLMHQQQQQQQKRDASAMKKGSGGSNRRVRVCTALVTYDGSVYTSLSTAAKRAQGSSNNGFMVRLARARARNYTLQQSVPTTSTCRRWLQFWRAYCPDGEWLRLDAFRVQSGGGGFVNSDASRSFYARWSSDELTESDLRSSGGAAAHPGVGTRDVCGRAALCKRRRVVSTTASAAAVTTNNTATVGSNDGNSISAGNPINAADPIPVSNDNNDSVIAQLRSLLVSQCARLDALERVVDDQRVELNRLSSLVGAMAEPQQACEFGIVDDRTSAIGLDVLTMDNSRVW